MVNATNNKKEYLAVTSSNAYPVGSIEEAIYTFGQEGFTLMKLSGPLKMSYKYVCDVFIEKDCLKGGDDNGLS